MSTRQILAATACLATVIAGPACGGSKSNGQASQPGGEELTASEAEKTVEEWAEARRPAKYRSVSASGCHSTASNQQTCLYVYYADSGSRETRQARVTRSPSGYLSVSDRGPAHE
jgi:hypothetical protein